MESIGDYTIQKELGSGAFGEIYLAEHQFIKKTFAIKVLPEEIGNDPIFIRRFEEQVAKIASLEHPNIIKIHNVSCDGGRYFIVMDPVIDSFDETMNLDRFLDLRGSSLIEKQKRKLISEIASALDYAHEKEIVHGSLKLTNILVALTDQGPQILLSDFGITRLIGEGLSFLRLSKEISKAFLPISQNSSARALSQSRNFIRSFAFLSPEQKALDGRTVDAKSDVYAFGVLAYYILTRKIPEGCFDLPSKIASDMSGNWDLLINRCLQINPTIRPQKLTFAMNEYLQSPKITGKDVSCLSEVEEKSQTTSQLAFAFPYDKEEVPVHVSASLETKFSPLKEDVKPVIKPQEIARPDYSSDPSAIFQRELQVSHYTPKKVEIKQVEPILTEMVVIPGGKYTRGSTEGARDELPRHHIHLPSFAMDIHPVTNEQFVRFLEAMGGEKDENNNDIIRLRDSRIKRNAGKLNIESGYAKHPVTGVTWYGASNYAKWIGKRLPSEAEWEVAASGGRESFIFPTGQEIDKTLANFFSSDTTSVMSYPPNSFGFFDMCGNVYEWCQDWYAYNYYDASALEPENPKGPGQGVYRVLRGGCWKSLREDLRCSHRHRNNPGALNGTYGFRCATDVVTS